MLTKKSNRPSSDSDSCDKVSRISLLLAGKDGLLVCVFVNLSLEIDVRVVDNNIRIKLSCCIPSSSEVAWEITARLY